MAVCKLTNDILKTDNCGYGLKQIVKLFAANYSDVVSAPLSTDGNSVASFTMKTTGSGSEAVTARWYSIEVLKNSASFSDELQVGNNGIKYRAATVSWSNGGSYTKEVVDKLDGLALGEYMIVALLSDGSYILFGRMTPMEATSANLVGEAEATGAQGTTYTLTNNSNESPLPLEQAAINTVLGVEENG